MSLCLQHVPSSEKDLLKQLMNDYLGGLYLSKETKLCSETVADYKYFDDYWSDVRRHPLFIIKSNEVVGFTLIRKLDNIYISIHEVAEFCILPKHRRNGYGNKAVEELLLNYPGYWRIQVYDRNKIAFLFWENIIENHAVRKVTSKFEQRNETCIWQWVFVDN
jgi:predicted acetyltransferase